MTKSNYEYWPFGSATDKGQLVLDLEKIEFLEAATQNGFEAFRFGINDYGARSNDREGCILERGRQRWEIRLAESESRRLLAFVGGFGSAGRAVTAWISGSCAQDIVIAIYDQLIVPPGAKSSHIIYEGEENQHPELTTTREIGFRRLALSLSLTTPNSG